MSNETGRKTTTRRSKAATVPAVADVAAEATAPAVEESVTERVKLIPKEVDLNEYIVVRSGYNGRLVYKSPRTGEKFVWPEFGSEQMIELFELRSAKNTMKKFFTNNWFMFDDDYSWVVDYLGVGQFYKHALSLDNFDDLFAKSPAEIEETIAHLSDGQKKSVSYRARQLIAKEAIDSNKAIAALERALGVELIERG